MKIRSKIFGAFGVIVASNALVGLLQYRTSNELEANQRRTAVRYDALAEYIDLNATVPTYFDQLTALLVNGGSDDAKLAARADVDARLDRAALISQDGQDPARTRAVADRLERMKASIDAIELETKQTARVFDTADVRVAQRELDGVVKELLQDQFFLLVAEAVADERVVVDEALARSEQLAARQRLLALTSSVLVLLLTVVCGLLLATLLTRPIHELIRGTRAIRRGQLDHRIPVMSTDELGQLARDFNQMAARLETTHVELEAEIDTRVQAEQQVTEARDAALAASRAKSTFLANMSHELRTPLNAILGYSELIHEEADERGDSVLMNDLGRIQTAGRHLLELISNVLDLAKIEAGRMTLSLEPVHPSDLVHQIATTVEPMVSKNGSKLEVDVAPDLPLVRADRQKLAQALLNLAGNAAKFTEGGTVRISVSAEDDGWVAFRVADTGIGMSSEDVELVFDEFAQADSSSTRKYGGTGLGLPISRKLCQLMGGDITVSSELGVGSTFEVRIPTSDAVQLLPPVTPGRPIALVIDDDPVVHVSLGSLLEAEGYDVHGATSGTEGLALARDLGPAVILLDIVMEGLDGWAVLGELKADPGLRDTPVMIITSLEGNVDGVALGASDCLRKPLRRDPLRDALGKLAPRGSHALVVDDEADARDLTSRLLRSMGWTVDVAENGRAALDKIEHRRPDLIVLDMLMPEVDGLEFLARLGHDEIHREIPVLVVTAMDIPPNMLERMHSQVRKIIRRHSDKAEHTLLSEIRGALQEHARDQRRAGGV